MKRVLPAAIFWNESHLWGIWLYKALRKLKIKVELLSVEELETLTSDNYSVFFIPGGWSSNKLKALDEKSKKRIRNYIEDGGVYFGICGGAGLATEEGLGLVEIRKNKNRVPGYSGTFLALIENTHPLFKGIKQPIFYLFYPPDFEIKDKSIKVLASFLKPGRDAFSSDLPVVDFEGFWEELETFYEIALNPERMKYKPVFIESELGKGKIYLSLIHVDTPGDKNGAKILENLSFLYSVSKVSNKENFLRKELKGLRKTFFINLQSFAKDLNNLILLGERNFLFYRRYPFLYQWRRGIRGLEYLNLWIIFKELLELLPKVKLSEDLLKELWEKFLKISSKLQYFLESSCFLLIKERLRLNKEKLTYKDTQDEELKNLRKELFGESRSYGGLYKEILDTMDYIFFKILKEYNNLTS